MKNLCLVLFCVFLASCSPASHGTSFWNRAWTATNAVIQRLLLPGSCQDGANADFSSQLKGQMTGCQFAAGADIPDDSYRLCIDDLLETFQAIPSPQCREAFLIAVKNQLRDNVAHQITRMTVINDELNPADLDRVFTHLKNWQQKTQSEIYNHAVNSTLFPKKTGSEVRLDPKVVASDDIHILINQFWATFWKASRSIDNAIELTPQAQTRTDVGTEVSKDVKPIGALKNKQLFTHGLKSLSKVVSQVITADLGAQFTFPLLTPILVHFNKRMQFFANLADLGCQLGQCPDVGSRENDLSLAISALNILDQPYLPEAVQKAREKLRDISNPEVRQFLGAFFADNETSTRVFKILYRDANGGAEPNSPTEPAGLKFSALSTSQVPREAIQFITLMAELNAQNNSFTHTGLFGGPTIPEVGFGFTTENIEKVRKNIDFFESSFEKSDNDYMVSRERVAQELQRNQAAEFQKLHMLNELEGEIFQLNTLKSDLRGLQIALTSNRRTQYSEGAMSLFHSQRWRDIYAKVAVPGLVGRVSVAANDVVQAKILQRLSQVAVIKDDFKYISAKPADILTLNISGKWSPNCALKKSKYGTLPTDPQIGPEGYSINASLSDSKVVSTDKFKNSREYETKESSHTHSKQKKNGKLDGKGLVQFGFEATAGVLEAVAGDLGRSIGGIVKSLGSLVTGAMDSEETYDTTATSEMSGTSTSTGTNTSQLDSAENRNSASFELGLRLPNTPFPNMPAGSLLLVQVAENDNTGPDPLITEIVSVDVARPNIVKLVDERSRFYLVVNDCRGTDTKSLYVDYSVQENQDAVAKQMTSTLLVALKEIQEKTPGLLQMGELSSVQLQNLETSVRAKVAQAGYDLEQIPLLRPLFQNWLSNELELVDLKIRIRQAEKKLKSALIRTANLIEAVALSNQGQELAHSTQIWALDNFDLVVQGQEVERAVSFLKNAVMPVLKVRFPKAVSEIANRFNESFSNVTFDTSVIDVSHQLQILFNDLHVALNVQNLPIISSTTAVLSFPKMVAPFNAFSDDEEQFLFPYAPTESTQLPWLLNWLSPAPLPTRDLPPASYFGTFVVEPSNLYARNSFENLRGFIGGVLPCKASLPVIEAMGIYFRVADVTENINDVKTLNAMKPTLDTEVISNSIFPTENRPEMFRFAGNVSNFAIPVFFGRDGFSVDSFEEMRRDNVKAGAGISPFSRFKVDFKTFGENGYIRRIAPHIVDIQLLFQVNSIQSDRNINIPRCQQ